MATVLLMSRFFSFASVTVIAAGLGAGLVALPFFGCGSSATTVGATSTDAGMIHRDAAPVAPTEAGPAPYDAGETPPPSCEKYCDLVMTNCTGATAQYASTEECLGFCKHLPLVDPMSGTDEKSAPSVACRQYWAETPAHTSPETYCLVAGPFGGNMCGDRCTAFCGVLLDTCSPDGGIVAYANQPDCATACAGFSYRDAGVDGGGESPEGPSSGDTLNCRLYWLRDATKDETKCVLLSPQSDVCKQ